jgi:hypothetical protein
MTERIELFRVALAQQILEAREARHSPAVREFWAAFNEMNARAREEEPENTRRFYERFWANGGTLSVDERLACVGPATIAWREFVEKFRKECDAEGIVVESCAIPGVTPPLSQWKTPDTSGRS